MNAEVGNRLRNGATLEVNVLNLLNTNANDMQYFYGLRLNGQGPNGVDDIHFHPAEPGQVRLSLEGRL